MACKAISGLRPWGGAVLDPRLPAARQRLFGIALFQTGKLNVAVSGGRCAGHAKDGVAMDEREIRLSYFFDPLCGWCYASAPALAALAARYPDSLSMMPSGLFSGPGSQPLSAIAAFAWRNDQRIGALTGQRFSEAYRTQVLDAPDGSFDSEPATRALVALGEIDPALEPRFLDAVQLARYVDGRDTCRVEELAKVAGEVVTARGGMLDEPAFAERLRDDAALRRRMEERIAAAQSELRHLPSAGVPQLLAVKKGRRHVVNGEALYQGPEHLLDKLDQL